MGAQSHTDAVLERAVSAFMQQHPGTHVTRRHLADQPLPHLAAAHLSEAPAAAAQALQELKACDVLLIGAPMYNFGIPSGLKAWIDHVVKAGETFRYTEQGPQGLLHGKRALVVVGAGGRYDAEPASRMDFVTPYLKAVLGFVGIQDCEVIRVEGVALGSEVAQSSLAQALEAAQQWGQGRT